MPRDALSSNFQNAVGEFRSSSVSWAQFKFKPKLTTLSNSILQGGYQDKQVQPQEVGLARVQQLSRSEVMPFDTCSFFSVGD